MMSTVKTRLALAQVTAELTTDFDVPTLLHSIATHAQECFDAASAVVILLDPRSQTGPGMQIVAEAVADGSVADPRLHLTGPGMTSARDGVVAMINDLNDASQQNAPWGEYRPRARARGFGSVRAFPMKAISGPLGSVIVHTTDPWGTQRPNDFGQVLADLAAIALSMGHLDGRVTATSDTVEAVLHGTTVIATAVGILAESFDLDLDTARTRLLRLARAHQVTATVHAAAIVAAQNSSPNDLDTAPALHLPPDLKPPTHIHR